MVQPQQLRDVQITIDEVLQDRSRMLTAIKLLLSACKELIAVVGEGDVVLNAKVAISMGERVQE